MSLNLCYNKHMRALLTLFCLICFAGTSFSVVPTRRVRSYPEGTFRKQRNGAIVQYDKNGKKIGIYKLNNGRYIKTK